MRHFLEVIFALSEGLNPGRIATHYSQGFYAFLLNRMITT
jgi:hypothetical protein